ncbi:MAG: hypothetical protein JWQ41_422 [Variovorax sp.]|nr:hypothetical protein [Variovorax sp.]
MSIPSIKPGASAAAVAQKDQSRDPSASAKNQPLVFSRSADAQSMASVSRACQVNGRIPNYPYLKEAMTGDLMRIVRDLKADDVPSAKHLLKIMSTIELDDFFKNEKIDPSLLSQLKTAIHGRAEAHSALKEVFMVLEKTGASRLHRQLRPAASA